MLKPPRIEFEFLGYDIECHPVHARIVRDTVRRLEEDGQL